MEPLLNICILLWLLGLAAATALGRGGQYISGSEGMVLRIIFWPARVVIRWLKQLWRQVGRQLWRVVVSGVKALWERISRW